MCVFSPSIGENNIRLHGIIIDTQITKCWPIWENIIRLYGIIIDTQITKCWPIGENNIRLYRIIIDTQITKCWPIGENNIRLYGVIIDTQITKCWLNVGKQMFVRESFAGIDDITGGITVIHRLGYECCGIKTGKTHGLK